MTPKYVELNNVPGTGRFIKEAAKKFSLKKKHIQNLRKLQEYPRLANQ
jgi:hypothetical protein